MRRFCSWGWGGQKRAVRGKPVENNDRGTLYKSEQQGRSRRLRKGIELWALGARGGSRRFGRGSSSSILAVVFGMVYQDTDSGRLLFFFVKPLVRCIQ